MGVFLPSEWSLGFNTLNFWCFIFSRDSHLQKLQRPTIQQVRFCQVVIDRTGKTWSAWSEARDQPEHEQPTKYNQQSTVHGSNEIQKIGLLNNSIFHFSTQKKHQHTSTSQ